MLSHPPHRLSVAPMMDWTDRHCRFMLRQITRRALLYTEMITTGALLYGDRERHLGYDPREQPLAIQLGGSEPAALAETARMASDAGYCEVNLNVGCPSDRVQTGRFGACLMAEPGLVADCVAAMVQAVDLPVTVKTRIGIDEEDSFGFLLNLVDQARAAGAAAVTVHARKAWLQGLSPKENREVPPLNHERVHELKAARPDLTVILNGGIVSLDQAEAQLARGLDGVMLGRAAYQDPWVLAEVDRRVFGASDPLPERRAVVSALLNYAEALRSQGRPIKLLTRHMMGLMNGLPGARRWRRILSEEARQPEAGPEVIARALAAVSLDAPELIRAAG